MNKLTGLQQAETKYVEPTLVESKAESRYKKPRISKSTKGHDTYNDSGMILHEIDGANVSDKTLKKRLALLAKKEKKSGKHTVKINSEFNFSKNVSTINAFLENDDGINAKASFNKRMLQALLETIPIMEEKLRKKQDPQYVYALKNLIDQARDLMFDLTDTDDGNELYTDIFVNIMMPTLLGLGKNMLLGNDMLTSELLPHVTCTEEKLKRILGSNLRKQVEYIDIMSESIDKRIRDRLGFT